MKFKEHLGEWCCILGNVLITVMLIDVLGLVRSILLGCGMALLSGGIIRVIKRNSD